MLPLHQPTQKRITCNFGEQEMACAFKKKKQDEDVEKVFCLKLKLLQCLCVVERSHQRGINFFNSIDASSKDISWSPAPENWYKLNLEAAIFDHKPRAGVGAIINNHKGELMAAAVKTTSFDGAVELAEVEGINSGVEIAKNSGFLPLVIESDSNGSSLPSPPGSPSDFLNQLPQFPTTVHFISIRSISLFTS